MWWKKFVGDSEVIGNGDGFGDDKVFGDAGNVQVSIVEQGDRPQLELDSHQGAVGTWEEDWELSDLIEHDQPCFLLYR